MNPEGTNSNRSDGRPGCVPPNDAPMRWADEVEAEAAASAPGRKAHAVQRTKTPATQKAVPSAADGDVQPSGTLPAGSDRPPSSTRRKTTNDAAYLDDGRASLFHAGAPTSNEVICSAMIRQSDGGIPAYLAHPIFGPSNSVARGAGRDPTGLEWPARTSIWCWHCCHPFDGVPITIPRHYDRTTERYTVFGVFCSFGCAKGYMIEHHSYNNPMQMLHLSRMAQRVFGRSDSPIAPAPPRSALRCFGGWLTIDEFRGSHERSTMLLRTPPFVSYTMVFEERLHPGCPAKQGAPHFPDSVGTRDAEDRRTDVPMDCRTDDPEPSSWDVSGTTAPSPAAPDEERDTPASDFVAFRPQSERQPSRSEEHAERVVLTQSPACSSNQARAAWSIQGLRRPAHPIVDGQPQTERYQQAAPLYDDYCRERVSEEKDGGAAAAAAGNAGVKADRTRKARRVRSPVGTTPQTNSLSTPSAPRTRKDDEAPPRRRPPRNDPPAEPRQTARAERSGDTTEASPADRPTPSGGAAGTLMSFVKRKR